MDLVERYVYAVGRRLPANQRADIERELKSLIQDSLDARATGGEPTEDDIVAVLTELGHPAKMAENYTQQGRYLIGPRFYALYQLILSIVLAAMAFGLIVSYIVSSVWSAQAMATALGNLLLSLFDGALSAIGTVTLIFALVERYVPDKAAARLRQGVDQDILVGDSWDPRALPSVPQATERVKVGEAITGIVFAVIGAVILNRFPNLLAVGFAGANGLVWVPVLNPAAVRLFLPYWDICLALTLLLNILLLRAGRRTMVLRICEIVVSCTSLIALIFMLRGPQLISPSLAADLTAAGVKVGNAALADVVHHGVHIALLVASVILVIDIIVKVYRLARQALEYQRAA